MNTYSFETLENYIGHDFGLCAPIVVDQARINKFAETTNDHQWIHVDVARAAKESPTGTTIAHGFLTLSLVAGAIDSSGILPPDAKAVFNYGMEKVRFLAPVPAGSTVRARFVLKDVESKGPTQKLMTVSGSMEIDGQDKPALVGDFMAYVVK